MITFRLLSYLMLILNLNVDGKTNVNNLEKAIDNLEEKKVAKSNHS